MLLILYEKVMNVRFKLMLRPASCYLLPGIFDVLRLTCEKTDTTYEIMESFQAMFRHPFD